MNRVDILSPHYDDAVLSCWHQIDQPETQIVTVFGGEPTHGQKGVWDSISSQNSASDTIEMRRAENRQAIAGTQTTTLDLDFLDRQYAPFKKRDVKGIADTVEDTLGEDSRIIAALGIGKYLRRHPDHITTRKVALELAERGRDVTFYADIPYMLPARNLNNWPALISVEKVKRTLDRSAVVESHELSLDQQIRKQSAVKAFATQYAMVNKLALGALSNPLAYRWEATIRIN